MVIHDPFSAHANEVRHRRAVILNVPLSVEEAFRLQSGDVGFKRAPSEAMPREDIIAAMETSAVGLSRSQELPDQLANDLEVADVDNLGVWARAKGIGSRTLLRQFRAVYGVSPAHYRLRARARQAWRALMTDGSSSLTSIALGAGFADHAHMSRAVRWLTGEPPSAWRSGAVSV